MLWMAQQPMFNHLSNIGEYYSYINTYESKHYDRFGGAFGYSDEDIDTIFDGDPSAYWNID